MGTIHMSMQLMIEDLFAEGLYPFGFYKWEKNQLHTTYQNDPIARFHVEVLPICRLTSARCGTWGRYFVKTGFLEVSANRPEESGQQTLSFNLQPSSHSPPGTPSVPIARYVTQIPPRNPPIMFYFVETGFLNILAERPECLCPSQAISRPLHPPSVSVSSPCPPPLYPPLSSYIPPCSRDGRDEENHLSTGHSIWKGKGTRYLAEGVKVPKACCPWGGYRSVLESFPLRKHMQANHIRL